MTKNLYKQKREEGLGLSQSKGFTIIEVLIVLAIAGLIILIVFLAVPALQRNSRNTQRKNDVSALVGSLQETIGNNNGSLPATCNGLAPACWVRDAKMTQFDNQTPAVAYTRGTNADQAELPATDANKERINIWGYQKCSGTTTTNIGATSRSVAVQYLVEKSGGTYLVQCVES